MVVGCKGQVSEHPQGGFENTDGKASASLDNVCPMWQCPFVRADTLRGKRRCKPG